MNLLPESIHQKILFIRGRFLHDYESQYICFNNFFLRNDVQGISFFLSKVAIYFMHATMY